MSYFDDASLVFIPSGYKTSKAYSIKPTDGSGDLAFSRSNDTATRVNSAGLIEKVRTNLVLQSQAFNTTANWPTNASPTITANTTVAPDGTTTADTIAATASFSGVYQSFGSVSNGVEYSWSVYIKNISSASNIFLGVVSNPSTATLNFDATSGTIIGTGGSITSSSVTSVGSGWYRLSGTYISTGTSTDIAIYGMGTMSFAVWGAQLETGVTTAYIATTSAAVSVGPVANVPRLDYLNSSCPRLLLEPQRTNLFAYSEQLDDAYWSKIGAITVTANNAVSPDGYQNADLVTGAGGGARIQRAFSGLTAGTRTLSCFVKAGTGSGVTINSYDGIVDKSAIFNVVTGVVDSTSAGVSATITNYGNGWYRLTHTYTSAGTSYSCQFFFDDGLTYRVWGMQFEDSASYATSYIPTLGAAVTRGADAASKTGISSLIGQTEGTLFAEVDLRNFDTSADQLIAQLFQDSNNRLGLAMYRSGSTNRLQFYQLFGGNIEVNINTLASAGVFKLAGAYKNNDYVFYVNGVQIGVDTTASVPTASSITLGTGNSGVAPLGNAVKELILFPTRLSNADLAALTA